MVSSNWLKQPAHAMLQCWCLSCHALLQASSCSPSLSKYRIMISFACLDCASRQRPKRSIEAGFQIEGCSCTSSFATTPLKVRRSSAWSSVIVTCSWLQVTALATASARDCWTTFVMNESHLDKSDHTRLLSTGYLFFPERCNSWIPGEPKAPLRPRNSDKPDEVLGARRQTRSAHSSQPSLKKRNTR